MHQSLSMPEVALNHCFTDLSLVGDAIGWDLGLRQLGAGVLDARITLLTGVSNAVMRVRFDKKVHQVGSAPASVFTFGITDLSAGTIRFNGADVSPDVLLNFSAGEFSSVNPSAFVGHTLTFSADLLADVAAALGRKIDFEKAVRDTMFWTGEVALQELRHRLTAISSFGIRNTGDDLKEQAEVFEFELAACIVKVLSSEQGQAKPRFPRKAALFRARALGRALELIEANEARIRVSDLSRAVGASVPTLERAFAEEFGISPKRYLLAQRLNSVRHDLIAMDRQESIGEIANRWEFWNMGRFAFQYQRQFGELPSQTLQLESGTCTGNLARY